MVGIISPKYWRATPVASALALGLASALALGLAACSASNTSANPSDDDDDDDSSSTEHESDDSSDTSGDSEVDDDSSDTQATDDESDVSDSGGDDDDDDGESDESSDVSSGDDDDDDDATTSDDSEESTDDESDSSSDTGVDPDSPFGINGELQVIDGQLSNQYGKAIQLRGMGSHGLQWFEGCMLPSAFDLLANEWGADFVRLSMYIQEEGYETRPEYFRNVIDRLVDQCYDQGLYCIIDWHVHEPGDPHVSIDLAREFFEYMSKKHGDKGHVIYEICNEPSDIDWADIRTYAEEIIPIIRNNDPESVIVVGTPHWSAMPNLVIEDPLPDENLLYAMHFYAAEHGEDYKENVREAVNAGLGIFVTEFGTQQSSGDGDNDFDAGEDWLDLLAELKISWSNWNFSDDMRSGAVWQRIRDQEDESDPDKTGDVCKNEMWTDDYLKPAGVWVKERLSNPPDDFPTR
jgi:endoglucanase